MSFDPSRLIRPQCGAPNPLVVAAQHITIQPNGAMTAMSMNYGQVHQQQINFVREFQQRQQRPTSSMQPPTTYANLQYNNCNNLLRARMYNQVLHIQSSQNRPPQQSSTSSISSIGQQLEKISINDDGLQQEAADSEEEELELIVDYPFEKDNPFVGERITFRTVWERHYRNLRCQEAILMFESIVKRDPSQSHVWEYLSDELDEQKDLNKKIKATKMWMDSAEKEDEFIRSRARTKLVTLLRFANRYKEACWYMLDWLLNHSKYDHIGGSLVEYHQLSTGELSEKQVEYVKERLLEAARMLPNNADRVIQLFLADLFYIAGDKEKAWSCQSCANDIIDYEEEIFRKRLAGVL